MQEVLQKPEMMGRALRSISLRIRGYSEESEDGLEEFDDELKTISGDLINLTKTASHPLGVSVFKDGSTTEFKSLVDYLGEISEIWDEMTEKQRNDYLQKAFAKTQAQAGASIIRNFDQVRRALEEMDQASGSSMREMGIVEQSLSYKLNALQQQWVSIWQSMIDRGLVGDAIDSLTTFSEAIGNAVNSAGKLSGVAGAILGLLSSIKGVGKLKLAELQNKRAHSSKCLAWIREFSCYLLETYQV